MNIFVIGPHCSGTSSVAQLMHYCGFYNGEPAGQRPSPAEPACGDGAGRWLRHFNDDILWLFGADWRSATHLDVNTLPAWLHEWLQQRAAVWTTGMAQHGHWVGADPRLCLTAGFWLRQLPATLVVLCLRHPQKTLAALMQLQPGPFASSEEALAAWRRSFCGAVVATAGQPRLVLDYDRLLVDPKGEVARLLVFCRAHVPNYTPPAALHEQIADTLVPRWQQQLAQRLPVVHCEPHDIEAYEALLVGDQARLSRALADVYRVVLDV